MLDERLTKLDYYLNKLSLFIKGSYGMKEQFTTFFNVLLSIDNTVDDFFAQFPTVTDKALYVMNSLSTTESDILDKIGLILGVTRQFDVSYIKDDGTRVKKQLNLTNSELQKLIKAQIIKNNFQGSYEELKQFYTWLGLPIYVNNYIDIATVIMTLDDVASNTDAEKDMFLAGLFTVKSLGVMYRHQILPVSNAGVWDDESSSRFWDMGVWSA